MPRTDVWQELRAMRAAPPGEAAADEERRKTFAAALRQSEELADAADAVTYAAKPLELYYSLSQAGRAITAASSAGVWMLHGHGLSVAKELAPEGAILKKTVSPIPGKADSFHSVASTVGSPALAGGVALGALWAANPDLSEVPIPEHAGTWPPAFTFSLGQEPLAWSSPPHSEIADSLIATGGRIAVAVAAQGDTAADVRAALEEYPTLRGARVIKQDMPGVPRWAEPDEQLTRFGGDTVTVGLEVDEQITQGEFWHLHQGLASVLEVDPDRVMGPTPFLIGHALPELGGGPAPHPLLLWWALLYGLSSLARYEPAAWTDAVDRDRSTLAVPLERVLDRAAQRVPERVLDALKPE